MNPASFLEGRTPAEPIEHDSLETIEAVYSSCPDLKEEPFKDADDWFSDGSSFIKQGIRMAGYAVTTTEKVIESNPLPAETSAQKAELITLTRALELAENIRINIWMDSKYALLCTLMEPSGERERTVDYSREKQSNMQRKSCDC